MNELPKIFLTQWASTTLEPITDTWHVVIPYPTPQDWQIGVDQWRCIRFNAQPPTQGELA